MKEFKVSNRGNPIDEGPNTDTLPFTREFLEEVAKMHPTPFIIYNENGVRGGIRKLREAFSWAPGFKEYFAVKACPNPYILDVTADEGCGTDCSSKPELIQSVGSGVTGDNIMYTSNNTPDGEFELAHEVGAIFNFDDLTHIHKYKKINGRFPEVACCRYNPGPLKKAGSDIQAKPEDQKYGMTKEQLIEAYKILKEGGVKRFGLHTMVASNCLEPEYFVETARILMETVREIEEKVGIKIEFINIGGGIGIAYAPGQKSVDLDVVSRGVKKEYERLIGDTRKSTLKIVMEMGRIITGPYGYLVTRAINEKHIYKDYIGVDANPADFARPLAYGAYHHIVIPGKERDPKTHIYDINGSLCENRDKFAVDRSLPEVSMGDLIVLKGAGAHGFPMGSNYNAKLKCGELLWDDYRELVKEIRRKETIRDIFATLDHPGLKKALLRFT
jgi:diaminopimelate decarboxylase